MELKRIRNKVTNFHKENEGLSKSLAITRKLNSQNGNSKKENEFDANKLFSEYSISQLFYAFPELDNIQEKEVIEICDFLIGLDDEKLERMFRQSIIYNEAKRETGEQKIVDFIKKTRDDFLAFKRGEKEFSKEENFNIKRRISYFNSILRKSEQA
ncbi:hypothetical protein [Bacillus badius]|uniref:hypothetical protein n=2 Tax=Bacillus badius TaxID=1455 RepID=UPI0007B3AFF4|nr:hypothetical protein [Bacillus badius]KZR59378.1 hypothetical protein A3781_13340 [Bacillus badius]